MYKWKLEKNFSFSKKIFDKIVPSAEIVFDVSIVEKLKPSELKEFRQKFLELVYALRKRKLKVNCDKIRLQSIRYNTPLLGPEAIQLNICNYCNYGCKFCLTHSKYSSLVESNLEDYFMPFEDIKTVIRQANELGAERIFITGKGEPMLHRKAFDTILYALDNNLKVIMLTNASISKTVSKVAKLPSSSNLTFLVNLSAKDPKKFKLICNGSADVFNDTLENIRKLNEKHTVILNYMLYKDTNEDVMDFIRLAASLGIGTVRLKLPILYDSKHKEILLSAKERLISLQDATKISNFGKSLNVNVELKNIFDFYLQRCGKVKVQRCYHGWLFSVITVKKKVYNCCMENKVLAQVKGGDFKSAFFSDSYTKRIIEGKIGINTESRNWHKCGFCVESQRNLTLDKLVQC